MPTCGRLTAEGPPATIDSLTSVKLSAALLDVAGRTGSDRTTNRSGGWPWIRAATDPEADVPRRRARPSAENEEPVDAWQLWTERLGWAARTRWRRLRGRPAVTAAQRFALRCLQGRRRALTP